MAWFARFVSIAGFVVTVGAAWGQEPTAIVEDLSIERADLELMDYLEPGRGIALADGERLVLGYLMSCVRETIVGGNVVVGEQESSVDGGAVERTFVDCDGGSVVLASGQDQEAGATAMRTVTECDQMPTPDRVVYDTSPVVRFRGEPGEITISRLCGPEDEQPIILPGDDRTVDFRERGIALVVGASYRFEGPGGEAVVLISRLAETDQPALISRLVPL
jgi:hypothetical protein